VDWHKEFFAADAAAKALFRKSTHEIFKDLEEKIEPDLGGIGPQPRRP
jgi:hypothetical protein